MNNIERKTIALLLVTTLTAATYMGMYQTMVVPEKEEGANPRKLVKTIMKKNV